MFPIKSLLPHLEKCPSSIQANSCLNPTPTLLCYDFVPLKKFSDTVHSHTHTHTHATRIPHTPAHTHMHKHSCTNTPHTHAPHTHITHTHTHTHTPTHIHTRPGEVLGHSCGVSEEHHGPVGGADQPGGGARGATSKSVPWFPQDKACIRVSTIDSVMRKWWTKSEQSVTISLRSSFEES